MLELFGLSCTTPTAGGSTPTASTPSNTTNATNSTTNLNSTDPTATPDRGVR